jgi:hypothetical protein
MRDPRAPLHIIHCTCTSTLEIPRLSHQLEVIDVTHAVPQRLHQTVRRVYLERCVRSDLSRTMCDMTEGKGKTPTRVAKYLCMMGAYGRVSVTCL